MIETLLSDRAEERRALFEEAAGIGRYKDSRQAAMRRLEAAEADLTRLDDLVAEVESKVRSLSRQKRKAERHRELQARRLDLEVAIAREELGGLEESLRVAESRRQQLEEQERLAAAERSTTEATTETRRQEAAELGRRRVEVAGRLDAVRTRLDAREREALLADERRSHAETRLRQLVDERTILGRRIEELSAEIEARGEELIGARSAVESARAAAERRGAENTAVRAELTAARATAEEAAVRARDLAREIARAEGERGAAERRRRDAVDRRAETEERLEELRLQLAQMTDQTELWSTQAEEVKERFGLIGVFAVNPIFRAYLAIFRPETADKDIPVMDQNGISGR